MNIKNKMQLMSTGNQGRSNNFEICSLNNTCVKKSIVPNVIDIQFGSQGKQKSNAIVLSRQGTRKSKPGSTIRFCALIGVIPPPPPTPTKTEKIPQKLIELINKLKSIKLEYVEPSATYNEAFTQAVQELSDLKLRNKLIAILGQFDVIKREPFDQNILSFAKALTNLEHVKLQTLLTMRILENTKFSVYTKVALTTIDSDTEMEQSTINYLLERAAKSFDEDILNLVLKKIKYLDDAEKQAQVLQKMTLSRCSDIKLKAQKMLEEVTEKFLSKEKNVKTVSNAIVRRTHFETRLINAINKLRHYKFNERPGKSFEREFYGAVQTIGEPIIEEALKHAYSKVDGVLDSFQNEHNDALASAVASIPNNHLRMIWVNSLVNAQDNDMRRAGTRAIPSVVDERRRNEWIELLSGHRHEWIQRTVVKLVKLGFYTGKDMKRIKKRLDGVDESRWGLFDQITGQSHVQKMNTVKTSSQEAKCEAKDDNVNDSRIEKIKIPKETLLQKKISKKAKYNHEVKALLGSIETLCIKLEEKVIALSQNNNPLRETIDNMFSSDMDVETLKTFYLVKAAQYLKSKQGAIKQFLRWPVELKKLLEVARSLVEVSIDSGNFILEGISNINIDMLIEAHQIRLNNEEKLNKIDRVISVQTAMMANVDNKVSEKEALILQLQEIEKEASTKHDVPAKEKADHHIEINRVELKELKEQQTLCEQSLNNTVQKLQSLKDQIQERHKQAVNAIIYGTLNAIQTNVDELEDTLDGDDLKFDAFMQQADNIKFQTIARSQQETTQREIQEDAKRRVKKIKEDLEASA